MPRVVVVTGTGLVSCRGEGDAAHLTALQDRSAPPVTPEPLTGRLIHAVASPDWDRQIPVRADQRRMAEWQQLGCYGAGLALEAAGLREDAAQKARMQMIVAAGGGERDFALDAQILTGLRTAEDPDAFLNTQLTRALRPTLFLAQLSNLLAGNIAIVHGVTGGSRTFMGEEAAGLDALRIAESRIAAGQADIMLVGGAFNASRPDLLLIYELGRVVWSKPWRSVAERPAEGGGFLLGSGAGFLVLEAQAHAAARGATALAQLHPVCSGRSRRAPGDVGRALAAAWPDRPDIVLSAASGAAGPTEAETESLAGLAGPAPVHMLGDLWGQMMEAAAPAAAALATALVAREGAGHVVATVVGHRRGEGLLHLGAIG